MTKIVATLFIALAAANMAAGFLGHVTKQHSAAQTVVIK